MFQFDYLVTWTEIMLKSNACYLRHSGLKFHLKVKPLNARQYRTLNIMYCGDEICAVVLLLLSICGYFAHTGCIVSPDLGSAVTLTKTPQGAVPGKCRSPPLPRPKLRRIHGGLALLGVVAPSRGRVLLVVLSLVRLVDLAWVLVLQQ